MSELQSVAESRAEYLTAPMWVEVLVDCPGAQGVFTYSVPSGLRVQPGDILSVPFGAQQVGGIAVRVLNDLPKLEQIRSIDSIVSAGFFPASYWTLLDRVARYYQTSLMQVVRVALPPGLLARSQRRIRLINPEANEVFLNPAAQQILKLLKASKTKGYSWQFIQRQVKGAHRGLQDLLKLNYVESYLEPPATIRPQLRQAVILVSIQTELRERQREILEVLKRNGGEMWLTDLLQHCRTTSATVKRLQEQGCVILQGREVLRSEHSPQVNHDAAKSLTPDQAQALERIQAVTGFEQILLHGVTGSGKTEVYLQAIAPILERGQSALVLVPEIGLTPQLTDRFRARFGDQVCVYHSALSDGERFDTWRQMLTGSPQVAIGTRSAIFAPLPNLGLIVLDEEHDSSFKQDQPAPCYHARSVAQWRAELEDCPLILGSATPSLESWLTAQSSTYLSLPKRILDRPLPQIDVIDMRRELHDRNSSILSRSLQSKLKKLKENNQKGLLFIHRRGHSTFVSCRSCGYVMDCPNCDVSLSYHHVHENAQPLLRCHYCNHTQSQPERCPACGSSYFKNFGSGTQRVVQELAKLFPDLKTIRFDSDTTRAKGAHRALLSQFAHGDADLLVGTQMLTKGIDLPQVTLVGIISADGLLNLADFRASERAFQTLVQVAGRAGRGTEPGRVILQTYAPENPVIQAVKRQQYEPFVASELEQRSLLNYPPYGRLVLLRFSGLNASTVQSTAETIADLLLKSDEDYQVLGPAPATIVRIAQRYRWQILLKLTDDRIPDVMELRSHCPSTVSLTIDVDPMNLM
ncbi:primosomal protein N' [Leptolyngbya sp. DQ-M1]|uniref:primosomal protein N' n=1 Tax=Leptolyngbya sp. DQ-M1 TaxID=2933920 RepID=UPI003297BBBC